MGIGRELDMERMNPAAADGKKKVRRRRRRASKTARRRAKRAALLSLIESPVKCAVHVFLLRYQSALRNVPSHLPPKVHAGPPSKRIKRVSWRMDEGGVNSGGGDPAVLAVGAVRRPLTYSRDQLMRLRNSPLVKKNLENAFDGCRALALVLKKRANSANDDDRGGRGDVPNENHNHKLRSADLRERVHKDNEGSGCGALAPSEKLPPINLRTKNQQGRRFGSGRIMVRDATGAGLGCEGLEYRPEAYRLPAQQQEHSRCENNGRYDRHSFGRDSYSSDMKRGWDGRFNENNRDREDNRRSEGCYSQQRFEKEAEPEWFTGGPTSKLETVELHGFDDPAPASTPADNNNKENEDKDTGADTKCYDVLLNNGHTDFNLDDFLKLDTIPDVLTDGGGETECSRFSRWFRQESSTSSDSKHYERLLHKMVDDLDKSTRVEGPHVSAPMSSAVPAAPSLLDLLRRANLNADCTADLNSVSGKMHSLKELEARLRPRHPAPPTLAAHSGHPDHSAHQDLSAFKRLLAQVSGGHAVPARVAADTARHAPADTPHLAPAEHPRYVPADTLRHVPADRSRQAPGALQAPPPHPHPQIMTLLQILNKSMKQQPRIPQELLYKLLQVRQRQQQSTATHPGATAAERELLQRPEAQAIIHGMKVGEITMQHLMQQLNNPGLQSRHRELLLTILRLKQQRQVSYSHNCDDIFCLTSKKCHCTLLFR